MNQITHHTEKQIEPINPMAVMGTLKGISPRSFEKTFSGLDTKQVAYAFELCLDGLTRDQIKLGMVKARDSGYCPDPSMFRKWCLGISGFADNVDPIHASYRSKNAALANIEAWLSDSTTNITNAEREAYNRCYVMFNNLKFNYSDKQRFHTYEAFKGFYDEVVKELVANGESQSIWDDKKCIETKENPLFKPVEKDYLSNMSDEEKNRSKSIAEKILNLTNKGMPQGEAMRKLMSESLKRI